MTKPVTAASYMRKAERALAEARPLLREKAPEGACNRAYYAMHDAAHAALIANGHEAPDAIIKTHHGLIAEFGKKLVQSGQVDAAFGRAFNKVQGEPPPLAEPLLQPCGGIHEAGDVVCHLPAVVGV